MSEKGEVTRLLAAANGGDPEALDRLVPLVYDELRGIAARRMAAERTGHTLTTTALVHEAYLQISGLDRIEWKNRAQFFAIAARLMRRILVDHAVRRGAQKRGGDATPVTLDRVSDGLAVGPEHDPEMLALDEALTRLEEEDERLARVVECRFFGGMTVRETGAALDVSPATVKRDWALARAWLNRELSA
jgi:RNA polymerase sigma factor (TIGR02999 family)